MDEWIRLAQHDQDLIRVASAHQEILTHEGLCQAVARLVGGERCVAWLCCFCLMFVHVTGNCYRRRK